MKEAAPQGGERPKSGRKGKRGTRPKGYLPVRSRWDVGHVDRGVLKGVKWVGSQGLFLNTEGPATKSGHEIAQAACVGNTFLGNVIHDQSMCSRTSIGHYGPPHTEGISPSGVV